MVVLILMNGLKKIINKNMMFSVEQDKNHDVTVNLLERVKQKRKELKELTKKDGDS